MLVSDSEARILDVGGRGAKLNWFLPENFQYTILDKASEPEDLDCEYRQGDSQKIPFSDRNFDLVISTDMLEHVDKPFRAPAIREMLRVSKNYLILGVPCGNGLISKAEEIIGNQYKSVTGREHPFLNEHKFYGLPSEEKIDEILEKEGAGFFKVKEGNLMSWYIQQLYTGTQYEQDLEDSKHEFNRFFNENLYELGNLRTPTYRTIYVIAKDGSLPETTVMEELGNLHKWNPEKFMELLEKGFRDLRKVIESKRDQLALVESKYSQENNQFGALQETLNSLRKEYEEAVAHKEHSASLLQAKEEEMNQLQEKIEKARKAVETYREAILEARNFLQEKERTIDLLKKIATEREAFADRLKRNEEKLLELLSRETELNQRNTLALRDKEIEELKLRLQLEKNENMLKEKNTELNLRAARINTLEEDLGDHQSALREVINSRAWKMVMRYSKVKQGVKGFFGVLAKGIKILITLGPVVFMKRAIRKFKKQPALQVDRSPYDLYLEKNKQDYRAKMFAQNEIDNFKYSPVISVVMPVYKVDDKWIVKAVESVRGQWYPRWELCICDDASGDEELSELLKSLAASDHRIKFVQRQHNGGIVKASNDALKLATGAYVTFLDDDDELTEDALYEVVKSLQGARYDLVYSDEDKIGEDGELSDPFFKPDWSPDLLLSQNYICHLAVYRRKIVEEIGRLREGYDGSQDHDLVLRFTEKTQSIKHIPKILYHWRKIPGSAAADVNAKPYAFESGKKAVESALKRRGVSGRVQDGLWKGSYRVIREIEGEPLVSIIIPFKDQAAVLKKCLRSILEKTTYSNFEILLVDNKSELLETKEYLLSLTHGKIRKLEFMEPFNFAAINNFAARQAKGEYLILLNNDTEVISPGWIEAMLEHAQRKEVGAVGAKLFFPNDLVQHAGVLVGVGGIANSSFLKKGRDDFGYFGQADVIRNYSAVTGACMMVRRNLYLGVGGLDEDNLAVTFNDIDFCLRLRSKGYLIVYNPYAQLYHHESLSRGYDVSLEEVKYMQREHRHILQNGDPYYNPNLSLERFDFSLRVMDKLPSP